MIGSAPWTATTAASARGRMSGPESSPTPSASAPRVRPRFGRYPIGDPLTESAVAPASAAASASARSDAASGETFTMNGSSVLSLAASMSRTPSSSALSQRAPSSASLGDVRSSSYASIRTWSARDSNRAINAASDFSFVATSEIATAQGAARHAEACRSITSSTPGFSRLIA